MDSNSLEEKFQSIETIIANLEKDDIPLETALEDYAKAKVMIEECKSKIDMVEKEVLKLTKGNDVVAFNNSEDELPF